MDDMKRYPPTTSTILTLDCWHQDCDFHELLEGIDLPGKTIFESDSNTLDRTQPPVPHTPHGATIGPARDPWHHAR